MEGENPENNTGGDTPSPVNNTQQSRGEIDDQKAAADRLERVEAALSLLADHLQTSTKGSEILEAEHSRSLLSSIAFGFSSIAIIAAISIDLARDDVGIELARFYIGMTLLLLASAIDLLSASLLRKAVHRAILEKEPSQIVLWHGHWKRFFKSDYWAKIKKESPEFYRHQVIRHSALAVYIIAGGSLVWAVFSINN